MIAAMSFSGKLSVSDETGLLGVAAEVDDPNPLSVELGCGDAAANGDFFTVSILRVPSNGDWPNCTEASDAAARECRILRTHSTLSRSSGLSLVSLYSLRRRNGQAFKNAQIGRERRAKFRITCRDKHHDKRK